MSKTPRFDTYKMKNRAAVEMARHEIILNRIAIAICELDDSSKMFDLAREFYQKEFVGKRSKAEFAAFVGFAINLLEGQFPDTAVTL